MSWRSPFGGHPVAPAIQLASLPETDQGYADRGRPQVGWEEYQDRYSVLCSAPFVEALTGRIASRLRIDPPQRRKWDSTAEHPQFPIMDSPQA